MTYVYEYDKEMFAGNAAVTYLGSDPVLLNLNTDNAYTFDNLCFRNMSLCRIVTLFLFFFPFDKQ